MRSSTRIERVRKNLLRVLHEMHRGRYLPQPWSFEDLQQEQFLQLVELLGADFQSLLADNWDNYLPLTRKATNRAIGKARWRFEKRKRRGLPSEISAADGLYGATDNDCESDFREYFSQLDEETETLIRLRLEGFSYEEIAAELGTSLSTVRRRFTNIKFELVEALEWA